MTKPSFVFKRCRPLAQPVNYTQHSNEPYKVCHKQNAKINCKEENILEAMAMSWTMSQYENVDFCI